MVYIPHEVKLNDLGKNSGEAVDVYLAGAVPGIRLVSIDGGIQFHP